MMIRQPQFLFLASFLACTSHVTAFAPRSMTMTRQRQGLRATIVDPSVFNETMTMIPSHIIRAFEDGLDDENDVQQDEPSSPEPHLWNKFSAPTLATKDMAASVAFYEAMGLAISFGGPDAMFTTLQPPPVTNDHASMYVNLFQCPDYDAGKSWGRLVIYCDDVDAMYQRALAAGFETEFEPHDAFWGERYFHILDPSGHELSFACPIEDHPRWTGEPWQHLIANHVKLESQRTRKPSQCV